MNNKKIDVIVYGDFNKNELKYKAYGAKLYIEILDEVDLLGKVICRGTSLDSKKYITAIPFGAFIPKVFRFIQQKTGLGFRNFSQNILFDFFASKKLRNKNVLSFTQGLKRCANCAKKNDNFYIEISATENMEIFLKILAKENEKFKLPTEKDIKEILLNGAETAKIADKLIVLSQHAKDTYVDNGYERDNVFVIEQEIDLKKIQAKDKYNSDNILKISCVAHFQILKGLHYLIKAVKELNNSNIELNIIGDLDENSKIAVDEFCGNIKSSSKINYIGKVSSPDKFLRESDIFVFPSLSEGFGRAIAEAMATGIPVIITKNCGVDIRNGIEGFVVESANVGQLKEKINFFLENRNKLKEMGENAKERITEICDEEKRKNKIRNLFENILVN